MKCKEQYGFAGLHHVVQLPWGAGAVRAITIHRKGKTSVQAAHLAFSRMDSTRDWVGWTSFRLCGSARPTTVGWISSYQVRP